MKTEIDTTTTRGKIAVMQAFERGQGIECSRKIDGALIWTRESEDKSDMDVAWNWKDFTYRIKPSEFPKLPEGMEWHNPHNLTPEQVQVEQGWRLLTKDENKTAIKDNRDFSKSDRQQWTAGSWDKGGNCGDAIMGTYRTRKPIPQPKKRVPLEASDIPPVCYFRQGDRDCVHRLPVTITQVGVVGDSVRFWLSETRGLREYPMKELMDGLWEYSEDRKNWKPCYKEI